MEVWDKRELFFTQFSFYCTLYWFSLSLLVNDLPTFKLSCEAQFFSSFSVSHWDFRSRHNSFSTDSYLKLMFSRSLRICLFLFCKSFLSWSLSQLYFLSFWYKATYLSRLDHICFYISSILDLFMPFRFLPNLLSANNLSNTAFKIVL